MLCQGVIVHFPTRLDGFPGSGRCRFVLGRGRVLEGFLNHTGLGYVFALKRSEGQAKPAVSPPDSLTWLLLSLRKDGDLALQKLKDLVLRVKSLV